MFHTAKRHLIAVVALSFLWLGAFAQKDTSNKALPSNALYMIDHVLSTKEEVEKLDANAIKSVDVFKDENADKLIKAYRAEGKTGVVMITTKKFDAEPVLTTVSTPAVFPDGADGWKNYLKANLAYPKTALKNRTEGTVRLQIIIRKDGTLTEAQALNNPGDGLAEEAMRLVKWGPKWMPAKQNGHDVTSRFILPVEFKL